MEIVDSMGEPSPEMHKCLQTCSLQAETLQSHCSVSSSPSGSDMSIVETASNESDAEHLGISVVEDMLWARRSFLCIASRHSPVGTGYPPLSLPLPCWGPGRTWAMAGWRRRRRLRFTGCGCQVGFQCPLPRLNCIWIFVPTTPPELLLNFVSYYSTWVGGVTIFIYMYMHIHTRIDIIYIVYIV